MGNSTTSAANRNALIAQGVPSTYIDANPQFMNGQYIDTKDMAKYVSGYASSNPTPATPSNIPTLESLASTQYSFDPSKYLPGIQQTAGSIYDPQRAQIDALAKLQNSQTEQSRIRTKEDFAKEMTSRVEAINQRGAFFSGGGLNAQADISKRENYALTDINLQDQASQAGFLAQQAGLSAAQAEYIQQKLTGQENSAYSRFTDNRNFLLSLTSEERRQMESDRTFNEEVRQFGLEYALEKKRLKATKKSSK